MNTILSVTYIYYRITYTETQINATKRNDPDIPFAFFIMFGSIYIMAFMFYSLSKQNNMKQIISFTLFSLLLTTTSADTLDTTLAGGNYGNGNMFDLCAKTNLQITSLDINCFYTGSFAFEIYIATVIHESYAPISSNSSSWTLIHQQTAICQPKGTLTVLNTFNINTIPALINNGDCRGFYVTHSQLPKSTRLSYTNGVSVGSIFASNADLDFKEGIGLEYPFGNSASPRVWNGRIHYNPVTDAPTPQPTLQPSAPTDTPTITKYPTIDPTKRPTNYPTSAPSTAPTKPPSMAPTISPTKYPTIDPTKRPTTYPTSDPTLIPSEVPTAAPSNDPTFYPTMDPTKYPTIPSLLPTIENEIIPSVTQTQLSQYTTITTLTITETKITKSSTISSQTIITLIVVIALFLVFVGLFLLQKKKVQRLKHANHDLKEELLSTQIFGKPINEEPQYNDIGNGTDMITLKDDNITKRYVELIEPEPGALVNDNYLGEQVEGNDGDGDVVDMVNTIKSNDI